MKKFSKLFFLLVFAVLILLQTINVKAETITPTLLTSKDSKNYVVINNMARKAFRNIKLKINIDSFPSNVSKLKTPLLCDELSPFYSIYKDGEFKYQFDKDTGDLKEIKLTQDNYNIFPNTTFTYSYPAGELESVNINNSPQEIFHFNPSGEYINYATFMLSLQKKIEKQWKSNIDLAPFLQGYKFKKSLRTIVNFHINKKGKLISHKIYTPSGDKNFDDIAMQTIKESAPFSELPKAFKRGTVCISFTFSYNVKSFRNIFLHWIRSPFR